MIDDGVLARQLQDVLREALLGSTGSWSYFIDNRADAGFLGAIAALSAAEASRLVAGASVAAHVHHAAFALGVAARGVAGDTAHADWAASWSVTTVDGAGWAELQAELRRQHEALQSAVGAHATASETALGEALGGLAHVAYHLGAVKQKIAVLRI